MRAIGAVSAALMLTGCNRPEVTACENFVRDGLRSPSSYRRIGIETSDQAMSLSEFRNITGDKPGGVLEVMTDNAHKHGIRTVSLEYDAQNGFGATLRETRQCYFRMRDGELQGTASTFAAKAKLQKVNREFRDLMRSGALPNVNSADVPPEPEPSCCL